jgi:hypothetical protein
MIFNLMLTEVNVFKVLDFKPLHPSGSKSGLHQLRNLPFRAPIFPEQDIAAYTEGVFLYIAGFVLQTLIPVPKKYGKS